jgi:hypothetical protein
MSTLASGEGAQAVVRAKHRAGEGGGARVDIATRPRANAATNRRPASSLPNANGVKALSPVLDAQRRSLVHVSVSHPYSHGTKFPIYNIRLAIPICKPNHRVAFSVQLRNRIVRRR